ncbi:ABC transporter substrate-binding protein [Ramlibacter sp.]|uniref:ABC transporter substrate-binding protein n=1 Tax=Ramlibacter sp. TaxID=1917967 RepID=UPI0035B32E86
MSNQPIQNRERRRVLQAISGGAALAVAAPFVITPGRARAQSGGKMVLVSYGGSYRTSVETALVKPFEKEFGVQVTVIDTPDLAKVKAQQMTGNIEWDVFDAVGAPGAQGSKAGYWEPLDPAMFDAKDIVGGLKKDLVPFYMFAGGVGWDPARFGPGKAPRNFAEYWDVKKFPGMRTLRNRPSETLEAALLADGVKPKDLYPLDLDRAFKALERIKPHIGQWVTETPQAITLLERGEVNFSYVYASRVRTQTGGKYAFSFDQALLGTEYLAVLKGAPNKANAMKFVQFAMRPDRQAALMTLLGNIPTSRKALPLVAEDARKWMGNVDNPNNAILNDEYWADKFDSVGRRFKEWVLA